MTLRKSNIEYLKIFCCPEGCKKRFDSVMAINVHLKIIHNSKYKIHLSSKGRGLARVISSVQAVISIKTH